MTAVTTSVGFTDDDYLIAYLDRDDIVRVEQHGNRIDITFTAGAVAFVTRERLERIPHLPEPYHWDCILGTMVRRLEKGSRS